MHYVVGHKSSVQCVFYLYKLASRTITNSPDGRSNGESTEWTEDEQKKQHQTNPDQSTYDKEIPNPFNKSTSCCAVYRWFVIFFFVSFGYRCAFGLALFVAELRFCEWIYGNGNIEHVLFYGHDIVKLARTTYQWMLVNQQQQALKPLATHFCAQAFGDKMYLFDKLFER